MCTFPRSNGGCNDLPFSSATSLTRIDRAAGDLAEHWRSGTPTLCACCAIGRSSIVGASRLAANQRSACARCPILILNPAANPGPSEDLHLPRGTGGRLSALLTAGMETLWSSLCNPYKAQRSRYVATTAASPWVLWSTVIGACDFVRRRVCGRIRADSMSLL
jgi:hypothetical protein